MNTWRLRLSPRAPWATPLRADSLFGFICWRWLELFPETFESMLDEFHEGDQPPFVLSDAFPGDLMPLPMHATFPQSGKKLKPPLYLPDVSFRSLMRGETEVPKPIEKAINSSSRVRTAIDRERGSAAEGQLFETDVQHLNEQFDTASVYIRSDRYMKEILACFHALALTGFGKKSSSGLGAFHIGGPPERCDWLDDVPSPNAFTVLSHFVPASNDPTLGVWRTHVTYPKFHANAVSNVFKGSVLMLTPGSVFHTERPPKPWCGSMIPMPRAEMPKAIHYALGFSVPLVWPLEAA
ncbi:MAG: hypothetical protein JO307_19600 [Bryobacterales bacterium]|nr:hypothetical protein [Bryobacterales bacterium]MBV9399378.1 hypothetical protein [Bryobacterales bacterium]